MLDKITQTGKLAALAVLSLWYIFPAFGADLQATDSADTSLTQAATTTETGTILPESEAVGSPAAEIDSEMATIASDAQLPFQETPAVFDTMNIVSGKELQLSLNDAVISALQKNRGLAVQRLETELSKTAIEEEKAAFDPLVIGEISTGDRLGKQIIQSGALSDQVTNRADGKAAVSRTSPTGTKTTFGMTVTRTRSNRAANLFGTRLGLDLTHPLRRGAGKQVNLVSVRQAELEYKASKHELEGFVLALTAEVEKKYWGFFLAIKELEIVRESHRLAVMQLEETNKKISLGSIPESELAAAEAEVALREEGIIDGLSKLETSRIALLRVTNPENGRFWEYHVMLLDIPETSDASMSSSLEHVENALKKRPEILQANVLLEKGTLETVQTKNGLLPQLDFFMTLGKTGYAQTFDRTATEFGQKAYDLTAGLQYEFSPGRREARILDQRARLSVDQKKESIRNLKQLVQEDVLTAYLEVHRSRQQMRATAKTVEKQKEKLRVEEIKFGLGKSTAFQVAQAQRDVADSQLSQMRARIGNMNALTDLWRFDGTLCERFGITISADQTKSTRSLSAPGKE